MWTISTSLLLEKNRIGQKSVVFTKIQFQCLTYSGSYDHSWAFSKFLGSNKGPYIHQISLSFLFQNRFLWTILVLSLVTVTPVWSQRSAFLVLKILSQNFLEIQSLLEQLTYIKLLQNLFREIVFTLRFTLSKHFYRSSGLKLIIIHFLALLQFRLQGITLCTKLLSAYLKKEIYQAKVWCKSMV